LRRLAERLGMHTSAAQVIYGGPLTGRALGDEDAVVVADTKALLLFSQVERARPVPCIRCGWCIEDCPVGIDPPSLMKLESEGVCNDQQHTALTACIDCGLCSHVCPSRLPLAETIVRNQHRFVTREPTREGTWH